ncbi:hypothetical protein TSUD_260040, partial [Trifolium subterraneum]
WHAVASWTWDAQDETCGICRMAFDGCCPDCKLPGDDCPLSMDNSSIHGRKPSAILTSHCGLWQASLHMAIVKTSATQFHHGLGCMQSRISFALYLEMGEFSNLTSTLPNVP